MSSRWFMNIGVIGSLAGMIWLSLVTPDGPNLHPDNRGVLPGLLVGLSIIVAGVGFWTHKWDQRG